jgi:hypothetical protein
MGWIPGRPPAATSASSSKSRHGSRDQRVLTKLQIGFCILAGVGIVVFFVAMITNVNVATVPGWLGPVAWVSFGLMVVSCLGVVVTLVLDRDKPARPADEAGPDEEEPEQPQEEPPESPLAEEELTHHDDSDMTVAYQPKSDAGDEDTMFHAGDSESFEIPTE